MTAGEAAAATGLGRASVSSMLSELAKAAELSKAARGYQLAGVAAAQRFYFRIEDDATPQGGHREPPRARSRDRSLRCGGAASPLRRARLLALVAGVFHNDPFAATIAAAEAQPSADSPTETVEQTRLALITVLQARHATHR